MRNKLRMIALACIYIFMSIGTSYTVSANDMIIDNRGSGTLQSTLGTDWQLVTDTVMGGVSTAKLTLAEHAGKDCLHLTGDVSTENNGGFVQMALSLSEQGDFDASRYDGIELVISGNNESYNLHIKTSGLWFPWQSYRASFQATDQWQTLRIPFAAFKPYKTRQSFHTDRLSRIGLLGIGREFQASLCLASIRFYTD